MNRVLFTALVGLLAFGSSAEVFEMSSDHASSVLAEGKERTLLSGSVEIESEKRLIKAMSMELIGKGFKLITGEIDVYIHEKENDLILRADKFTYDKDREITRIEGSAEMEDPENEMIVKCGLLENFDKDDIILMQVGVRILKEDIVCRSEMALYRREEKILELSGLPVVYKDDNIYRADRITVNLDNDEISLEGEVRGTIQTEDNKENDSGSEEPSAEEENNDAAES